MNISPSISPDGKWIAFLSERDVFNINLFIADAETGKVVKRLKGSNSDPHFDAIRFINSAGSWSPDGRKFVFVTFVEGDNELSILDWNTGGIERRIAVDGVTAMSNPAWSPDGQSIVFTGLDGGISDLYLLDLQTNAVRQLTNDRFGDLQPAWSPDGKTIAFVSDRGPNGTDFEKLQYSDVRLSFYDLELDQINTVVPFDTGMSTNPQFSPDGRSVFFISDHDGFKDVYRYSLDNDNIYRVTEIATGVSGITSLSPAMSVASQSGRMVFSVFAENKYSVFALEQNELDGTIVNPLESISADARLLPPSSALYSGLVGNYLTDPTTGLPEANYSDAESYGPRLKLDYVAPPTVGVTAGGPFGTGVAGGIGLFFSDMLGNHNLTVVAQANGTFKDIGGQVAYLNQKNRFNYGGAIAHIPYLIASSQPFDSDGDNFIDGIDLIKQRIFVDQIDVLGSYPFSTTKRFDLSAGFVRYGFSFEVDRFDLTGFTERERFDLEAPDPVYFAQTGAAFIGDFSVMGFTSPVSGGRYRLSVTPAIGSESFVRALVDYRRYRHIKPITVAVRGLHVGNYFAKEDPNDPSLFTQEYLGYSHSMTFIRGYSFSSFDPNEDFSFNNLLGSRIAIASAEVRIPLLGTKSFGILNFPYLPTEVTFFADGGLAWTKDKAPNFEFSRRPQERSPVVSTGISTRFNMFGYTVLELYYAYPWQRPDKGAHFGFQLIPGW